MRASWRRQPAASRRVLLALQRAPMQHAANTRTCVGANANGVLGIMCRASTVSPLRRIWAAAGSPRVSPSHSHTRARRVNKLHKRWRWGARKPAHLGRGGGPVLSWHPPSPPRARHVAPCACLRSGAPLVELSFEWQRRRAGKASLLCARPPPQRSPPHLCAPCAPEGADGLGEPLSPSPASVDTPAPAAGRCSAGGAEVDTCASPSAPASSLLADAMTMPDAA